MHKVRETNYTIPITSERPKMTCSQRKKPRRRSPYAFMKPPAIAHAGGCDDPRNRLREVMKPIAFLHEDFRYFLHFFLQPGILHEVGMWRAFTVQSIKSLQICLIVMQAPYG